MFNTLITWIRRLDPAGEYGLEVDPLSDDFWCRQMFDEQLQGRRMAAIWSPPAMATRSSPPTDARPWRWIIWPGARP
jgi:hypothetical protein